MEKNCQNFGSIGNKEYSWRLGQRDLINKRKKPFSAYKSSIIFYSVPRAKLKIKQGLNTPYKPPARGRGQIQYRSSKSHSKTAFYSQWNEIRWIIPTRLIPTSSSYANENRSIKRAGPQLWSIFRWIKPHYLPDLPVHIKISNKKQ